MVLSLPPTENRHRELNYLNCILLAVEIMSKIKKIALIIHCLAWAHAGSAELFRWVDEDGKVHYSDQVPAKDIDKGREVLNQGGRVIDKVEPARTPEEIAIYEEQQRIEKIRKEREAKQYARDRALLATFTTVKDLEKARDERIALVDQTIKIAYGRLIKHQNELIKLDKTRNNFKENEAEVPEWVVENSSQLSSQINIIEEYILGRELEKNKIKTKFDQDITRFKELTK